MPVRLGDVALDALARGLERELTPAAAARGQTLTVAVPGALAVRADPELLRRALANVVGNALKFTLPGGRIDVSAQASGEDVLIRVADDGPGIAARDLPHVFDRYYQGMHGQRHQGLGLGLAFCRAALRAMQGDVEVESEEGRGATFTLRLPRAAPEGGSP